jgi:predicted transcriptional regulator of viral defense system
MIDLEKFGNIPFKCEALEKLLYDYKSPNNKILAMEHCGEIVRLTKGLYMVADRISHMPVSRELIANHLYGTSYISLETALSFYDLIPEKTDIIRSMTTRRSKMFEIDFGNYEYVTVPEDFYSIGIREQSVNNEYTYLIASPEKAICDLILATPYLQFRTVRALQTYFEDNLQMNFSAVKQWDMKIIEQCIKTGRKQLGMELLETFLKRF